MRGGEAEARGINLQAVAAGWLLGTAVLAAAGTVMALVAWQAAVSPQALAWMGVGVRALAGLLAGLRAGARAGGSGLLNGMLAGIALLLMLVLVDSVRAAAPGMHDLLRGGGLLMLTGALGGILGANLAR